MTATSPPPGALSLLARAGLRGELTLHPMPGGGNNRVYRVDSDGRSALLKVYFRHPADLRDRLRAEFSLARYAWNRGIRCLPEPLACDSTHSLGLYAFAAGRRVEPREVDATAIEQALAFFHELNAGRREALARELPLASEAVFTLAGHRRMVEERLRRLDVVEGATAIDADARAFIQGPLAHAWRTYKTRFEWLVRALALDPHEVLSPAERRISPSDFGFHNALLRDDGRLVFIDFEYAGWDDPVRTVCDFFCQQAVRVSWSHFERFSSALLADLPDASRHRRRLTALLGLYQFKWCCIILNQFLPVGGQRRSFAGEGLHEALSRKAIQLEKARRLLAEIVTEVRPGITPPWAA
jgi:hypothetical protein